MTGVIIEESVPSKYWPVFLALNILVSGCSWISILLKKYQEKKKHQNIFQNIVNNLRPIDDPEQQQQPKFNTLETNTSIMNGVAMTAMLLFMVIFILLCVAVPFVQFEEQISTFAVQVMIERMAETFAKIVVPILYVILHKDFRSFINKSMF